MKVTDLGTLSGDILLFGGVYSNLQSLEALLAEAALRQIPAARMICTGDVVGYCADPSACIARLRDLAVPVLAGNVERQLAVGAGDCGCGFDAGSTCDRLSADWYGYASRQVSTDERNWMEDLPDLILFAHSGRRYAVVHGGLSDISRFIWPSSPEADFVREIAMIEASSGPIDGVIAGHCGIAFERVIGGVHWLNVGVIGMPPHDGRAMTRFAVLSDDGARHFRLSYDVAGAVAAMRDAGLPPGYDLALATGIWPSQDILPEMMRR